MDRFCFTLLPALVFNVTGGVDVLGEVAGTQEPEIAHLAAAKKLISKTQGRVSAVNSLESALALLDDFPLGLRGASFLTGLSVDIKRM